MNIEKAKKQLRIVLAGSASKFMAHAPTVKAVLDELETIEKQIAGLQKCDQVNNVVSKVPEKLPCPVLLEPALHFGQGVRTQCMLDALQRRAEYYEELETMTPEQRAEHDANIKAFKMMLPQPVSIVVPDEIPDAAYEVLNKDIGDKACLIADELWDACREAMLNGGKL